MNNNDYIDVEYEKSDKKSKSNKFCKVGVICLLIFTLMWFLSSLFINITKLNSFDKEEEIKTELVDKSLNKSRFIDKTLVSDIRQDDTILLNYVFANSFIYTNNSTINLQCNLTVEYDLNTNNYAPYMFLYFRYYDSFYDFEIDEIYDITSQILTDSSSSSALFRFVFVISNGSIDNDASYFDSSNGIIDQPLIPSSYTDLSSSYEGYFDYNYALQISNITNEVQYIESIANIYYEIGINEGLGDGYRDGYDDGYDVGYQNGLEDSDSYNEGYNVGYNVGYNNGLAEGEVIGYDNGYDIGYNSGVNNGFADNAFKKLFNVIMNAPFNIFSGLLNFEIFGVNLFALFSFVFTTMIIFAIVKIFLK